jgi:hypothetical protein
MGWRLCWTVREDSDGNYTDVTNTGGIIDRQDLSPTLQTDGHTHKCRRHFLARLFSLIQKEKKEKLSLPKRSAHMATTIHLLLFIVVSRDFSSSSYRVGGIPSMRHLTS